MPEAHNFTSPFCQIDTSDIDSRCLACRGQEISMWSSSMLHLPNNQITLITLITTLNLLPLITCLWLEIFRVQICFWQKSKVTRWARVSLSRFIAEKVPANYGHGDCKGTCYSIPFCGASFHIHFVRQKQSQVADPPKPPKMLCLKFNSF